MRGRQRTSVRNRLGMRPAARQSRAKGAGRGSPPPQHRTLRRQAEAWMEERGTRPFDLLLIELDQFPAHSEVFGDDAADALARRFMQRVDESVPGGRRFDDGRHRALLFVPSDGDASSGLGIASRLIELSQAPVQGPQGPLRATASIGVVGCPHDGRTFRELARRAGLALEYARRRGGNRCKHFEPYMVHRVQRRWKLSQDLKRAFEAGEFSIAYQPQLSAGTGRIVGAEALLRWTHPELGPQPPTDFVPVLEDSGLISAVGAWIARTGCRQARAWCDAGHDLLHLSINVSPRQVDTETQAAAFLRHLEGGGWPLDRIRLEITEYQLVRDFDRTCRALRMLAEAGVHLQIDDFATRHSSLHYLKLLPVSGLKLDRGFVCGLPQDRHDSVIVQTVLDLARSLELETVAEGVESVVQARFLAAHGVDQLQGYAFSPGVGATAFAELLERQPFNTEPRWLDSVRFRPPPD